MSDRPNILWICTDQQRYDTIAALGNPYVSTPHIDRLGGVLAGIQRLHFTHTPQTDQLHAPLVGPRDDVLIDRIERCIPPVSKRWERQRRIACIQHAGKHLI